MQIHVLNSISRAAGHESDLRGKILRAYDEFHPGFTMDDLNKLHARIAALQVEEAEAHALRGYLENLFRAGYLWYCDCSNDAYLNTRTELLAKA